MGIELSVFVVHYYAEGMLGPLFDSLRNFLAVRPSEILVWDNGSRMGKPLELEARYPLSWFKGGDNIGFAKGQNALAGRAGGHRFLILNPDARFAPGGLERLWQTAEENPRAGVVAPRIQYPDGRLQVSVFPPYTFGFDLRKSFWLEKISLFSRKQAEIEKKLNEGKRPFPVGWASGACILVSREVWERVGGFDPNFFFGGEDTDFCERVWEAGFEILCEPRAVLVHQAGQSLEREPRRKVLFYYQKRLYYACKHFSLPQRFLLWLISAGELTAKWAVGFLFSLFGHRWREKRRGYAQALALMLSGRWRRAEGLMQKKVQENQAPVEAAL